MALIPSAARRIVVLLILGCGVASAPAHAEIVVFTSGRTMSVASHEALGDTITFRLRGGGDFTCAAALIESIRPDEVPYPSPAGGPAVAAPALTLTFDPLIDQLSERHGVEASLVRAVVRAESGFQPQALSRKGAQGLMQLMPATAARLMVENPFDPRSNLDGGIQYLRSLLDRYNGKLELALAAYNAGEAVVERFKGLPPFPETRQYVGRVLSFYRGQR